MRLAEVGDRAVGFGAVIASGRGVHLADLFVVRERQGGGIGRRLLEAAFGDRWPRGVPLDLARALSGEWTASPLAPRVRDTRPWVSVPALPPSLRMPPPTAAPGCACGRPTA